ncbi:delta-lactam-biosynthetic de-N-acetylase [Salipaludibacillus neizhouensis]|uniref:Delta-lactam-biosynthetic de-N-acetylase n=1 Tax=Salipaludibacillus neizhouensis TaxID=885475 RepID=A0A3A9K5L1_9BACI|nr:delta-lactam-biosynthetic de-N-acetylase [Salipaludibacillus neizhouensis]RKL66150.1 delta-lactam-biosynthetic de-N-acetylase [Salipaludibacillus neizhouensis]
MGKKILFILIVGVLFALQPMNNIEVFAEELSKKEYHWNFNPSKNNEPASTEPYFQELLEKYGGFYLGDTTQKELFITFDNGYENGYTSDILDILKEKEVPAAFFVTGHYMNEEPELINRMVDEGHIVGNHSNHHPSLPSISEERLERELNYIKDFYKEITGQEDMIYLRPPRGTFSEWTLAKTQEMGYTNVFWSFAYVDWETGNQKGADYAYDKIMSRIHPGSVLLLHSVSSDNAGALSRVIDDLKEEGYTFKSLNEVSFRDQVPFNKDKDKGN